MRFLTLATHLLPVLALVNTGGLVSGNNNAGESLHQPFNDNVFDLKDNLDGNRNTNREHLIVDQSESQFTTVSSTPIITGQPLPESTIDENGSDSIMNDNRIPATKRMDNLEGAPTRHSSYDADDDNPEDTTKSAGKYDEITYLTPVISLVSNSTQNNQNQTDSDTVLKTSNPISGRKETPVIDSRMPLSSSQPQFSDETGSVDEIVDLNNESTVGSIITDPVPNFELPAKRNPDYETLIDDQNLEPNGSVTSDSGSPEEAASVNPVRTDVVQDQDSISNNLPKDESSSTLNNSYENYDSSPLEKIKKEEPSDVSADNPGTERSENWLSVLKSMVPSQKERLDFNEKMMETIQNTVSNTNVNHNVMNNVPALPCSNSISPSSSNLYPSSYWPSSPVLMKPLPAGIPIEAEAAEEYPDLGIESRYPYIEYTDDKEQSLQIPDQFVDQLNAWDNIQSVGTHFNPVIHIEGDIRIHGQSQPMRPTHRCQRILMKPEPICKRGKPICHTPWNGCSNGCKPICRPGKAICREHPSQRPRAKLVCKRIWERLPSSRLVYQVPSYVSPDYELIDDEGDLIDELRDEQSISEAIDCDQVIPEISPTPLILEGASDIDSSEDDAVSDEKELLEVTEKVFEEAIRKAINEAPEILAPEPHENREAKLVEKPRPEPLLSTGRALTEIPNPSSRLIDRKEPIPIVSQNIDADNKADKIPVTQSKLPLTPLIESETASNNRPNITNSFPTSNVNNNVNTNVNSNTNVNLNSHNAASQSVLPVVQVPVISPVSNPIIPIELSKNQGNSNTNRNNNMNFNVNQNHNSNVDDNVRLPIQPIEQPIVNRLTETPQADPTIPTFDYNTPLESAPNMNAVNQEINDNINGYANVNQQHDANDQIKTPRQPKVETPLLKFIPQVREPTAIEPALGAVPQPLAGNLHQNLNTNFNSNINIDKNNNVDNNAGEAIKPDSKETEIIAQVKDPVVLSNIVLPSMNQGNQNANMNTNLNVNSNLNKNIKPFTPKVKEIVPISIPEPIQGAEPDVEVAPIYDVPLLPALSASLNVNSNMNQNINDNVNSNSLDYMFKRMEQQVPENPINQPIPVTRLTNPIPSATSIQDLNGSVKGASTSSDQSLNENLHSNVNVNSNQNINHNPKNQAAQFQPEILPVVVPNFVLAPIPADVATLHDNSNRNANINHNINSNVNINSNGDIAVNAPELPKHNAPVLVRESRPVAVLPDPGTVEPVPSQVSQYRNVNSNTNLNFNSNLNNNANQMIAVPPQQHDLTIIKPVESQPVAAPNRLEIPLLTPVQNYLRDDMNGNANVKNNFNVNTNVNTNHNVNRNGNYDTWKKRAQVIPEVAKENFLVPAFTEPTVKENPRFEMSSNNDLQPGEKKISKGNEDTELNESHNIDVNVNRNSNININRNSNLNRNNNIENGAQILLATPAPAAAPIQEPILLPLQMNNPVSPYGTMLGPQVLRDAKMNANYAANLNLNRNSNSNANFNQNHQVEVEKPISFSPSAPLAWIEQPALQKEMVPNTKLNAGWNSDVNLNENVNTNINRNVNLNQNHNIVSKEPGGSPAGQEYFNTDNYFPILKPDVREAVMIASPTPIIEQKKTDIPQVMENSQINANHNANVNMNYNSNYNHNGNYNGKAVLNENDNGEVPLINPHKNISPSVVVPQYPDRSTGLWNLQKNFDINTNYNSNMNSNSNVAAKSNYHSNLGQTSSGTVPLVAGGTPEGNSGTQSPLFMKNPAIDTPIISNTKTDDVLTPTQLDQNAQQDINANANANFNSNLNHNLNYNANYNHDANYNAQLAEKRDSPKKKGWYELWYNNGDDKDGWIEIWNNKQFKRFLEQQLKDMKQQEDIQAQAQAQAFVDARYMAIMNPLRPRMGRRSTLCIAVAIWLVGAVLSLPMLLFYTTFTQNFVNGEVRVICYSDWPNRSDDGLSYGEYLYNVVFMILTYFLPIGSMTFTYARVGLELWGSQSIGEATQRQLDNIRSKRRVVKMMIVVVVIFAVCWLPFHVYFIVTSYLPDITNEPYIQEVYLAIYWLAMSNSMYNPIIYCWMNSRFRRGFAQFFSWCPWVRVAPEPSLSRSEAVTSRYSCTGSPDGNARISRNGTVRIPLHLQSSRGTMGGNGAGTRFPVHHRGHGKRWRTSQSREHVS